MRRYALRDDQWDRIKISRFVLVGLPHPNSAVRQADTGSRALPRRQVPLIGGGGRNVNQDISRTASAPICRSFLISDGTSSAGLGRLK
jgi:hypothetical protein